MRQGIEAELLDERLGGYDLKCLGAALDANRDLKFTYLGLQILYDRYFLHVRRAAASSCRRSSSCASRWGSR